MVTISLSIDAIMMLKQMVASIKLGANEPRLIEAAQCIVEIREALGNAVTVVSNGTNEEK